MSAGTVTAALDFGVLPLGQATELLARLARALAHDVLAQRPMAPLSTLLRPGEEYLLAPPPAGELLRHRRAAGIRRSPWPWARRPHPPELRKIGLAWRRGETSLAVSRVQVLERVEFEYQGLTAQHLPPQFWQMAAVQAWRNLDFQYDLALAIRMALRDRVLFTAADVKSLYSAAGGVDLLAPQTFWLLLAAADTCTPGFLWRRRERRLRLAAARLQEIADGLACTEHWAKFWDQWVILELSRQDKTWFGNLSPQLQSAARALPIFRTVPMFSPAAPAAQDSSPSLHLAAKNTAAPAWVTRLYSKEDKANTNDN